MADFSSGPKPGAKMKLYRNSGTTEVPVWDEIGEIGDLTVDGMEWGSAELARRANKYKKGLPTLIEVFTVGFRLIHGLDGDMFEDLKDDFFAGATEEYAVCNGAMSADGTQGLRFAGWLSSFPWDQPLEEVSGHDVVITHGYKTDDGEEIDPSWITIEGSG